MVDVEWPVVVVDDDGWISLARSGHHLAVDSDEVVAAFDRAGRSCVVRGAPGEQTVSVVAVDDTTAVLLAHLDAASARWAPDIPTLGGSATRDDAFAGPVRWIRPTHAASTA